MFVFCEFNQQMIINKFKILINMNILSSEEMQQTEIQLLNVATHSTYALKLPTSDQLTLIHNFHSSLFQKAGVQAQTAINKMVRLTNNVRAASLKDPNTFFRMFTYHILTVLYQQKYRRGSSAGQENNLSILQTIKCSLYSKNVDFSLIKNRKFQVNGPQIKALGAQFFRYMETLSSKFNAHRMKCAEWLLENNPLLLNLFVLLFRTILNSSRVQKAENYQQQVDPCDSIVNLLDFFDLGYRNFGHLFLQYEEGLFLSINEGEIVVGEYFQNEKQKQDEKQQLEIKSQIKINMIQSVLLTVDQKEPLIRIEKIGNDKDTNLFNFLLQKKSQQKQFQSIYINETDVSPNASNLKENKKLQTKAMKLEFQKVLLNVSRYEQTQDDKYKILQSLQNQSSPFFKEQHNFTSKDLNKAAMRQSPKQKTITELEKNHLNYFKSLKLVDTSIELDSFVNNEGNFSPNGKTQSKNYITHQKNKFKLQEFSSPLYTPQMLKVHDRDTAFNRRPSNNKLCLHEDNSHLDKCQNKLKNIAFTNQFIDMTTCGCRKVKINKNIMDHNVIDVYYRPKKENPYLTALLSPNNFNNKSEKFRQTQNLRSLTPHRYIIDEENTVHTPKKSFLTADEKKPTFFKHLKKNKNESHEAKIQSNEANSFRIIPQINDYSISLNQWNDRRFSEMIPHHPYAQFGQQMYSKSTTEDEQSKKRIKNLGGEKNKMSKKLQNITPYSKHSIGQPNTPWQTNSNFQQTLSINSKTNKIKSNNCIERNQPQSQAKMIYPNGIVQNYINSPKSNSNFGCHKKLNDQNPQKKIAPFIDPIPTIIFTEPKQMKAANKSQKVISCYVKQ